jgi:hypothetical protein
MLSNLYLQFTQNFNIIFYSGLILLFLYAFYVDFYKIKKDHEIMSGDELMYKFVEAKRRGLIK